MRRPTRQPPLAAARFLWSSSSSSSSLYGVCRVFFLAPQDFHTPVDSLQLLGPSPRGTRLYLTLASQCGSVWRGHHCMCPSWYAGMGPVLWSSLGTSVATSTWRSTFLGSMGRPYSADRWRCPYTSWYPCRIPWPCMRQSLRWGLALFVACFFPLNAFSVKVLRAVFPVRVWTLFWLWSTVVLLLYLFGAVVALLLVLMSWQMASLWPGAFWWPVQRGVQALATWPGAAHSG